MSDYVQVLLREGWFPFSSPTSSWDLMIGQNSWHLGPCFINKNGDMVSVLAENCLSVYKGFWGLLGGSAKFHVL